MREASEHSKRPLQTLKYHHFKIVMDYQLQLHFGDLRLSLTTNAGRDSQCL